MKDMKFYQYLSPKHILLLLPIMFIVWVRIQNNVIFFSDTNVYFYIARQILHGSFLYNDIFFTNLPFFAYFSVFYYLLTGANLYLFYVTAFIEVIGIGLLIYYIVWSKTKNFTYSFLCYSLFLFSTHVLMTISSQVGIFTATIFALLAYLMYEKKKFILSGIFLGLCIVTKAYFAPVLIAFLVTIFLKQKRKDIRMFVISFVCTVMIVLIPFLLFATQNFWFQLFQYSLVKKGEFLKHLILGNFLVVDTLLFCISLFAIARIKKDLFFGVLTVCFYLFFIFQRSFHSMYLLVVIPFLCVYAYVPFQIIQERMGLQRMVIPTVVVLYCIYTAIMSFNYYSYNQLPDYEQLVTDVQKINPEYIYGTSFITTAVAHSTNTPLLLSSVDTDDGLFMSGVLDNKSLTKKAIEEDTAVVVWGIEYHDGQTLRKEVFNQAVDKEELYQECTREGEYPFRGPYNINRLYLYKC